MIYNFLFPSKPNSTGASLFLLALRIFFGLLLMNHGIQKWSSYQELSIGCREPGIFRIGYLWRTCLFNGVYRRRIISFGYVAYDFYNGHGILCHSR